NNNNTTTHSILSNINNLISINSNTLPNAYQHIYNLTTTNKHKTTKTQNTHLKPFHKFYNIKSNPIPMKNLLHQINISHKLHLPLLSLSTTHHTTTKHLT
ncbi:4-hydroxy-tetrahydrodipicolinate synthase, partial [Escherichia coli]|nr:4-hydroxy-tetrahydrodipicolinate synthase [Escherichia coli]